MLTLASAIGLAASPAQAKDVRRLWFVGGALAYHTTTDAAENNASLESDPRPDDFVSRELTLDDRVQAGLHVGFGLTGSLTIQLEAGYYKGDVGSVDVYQVEQFPGSNVGDPFNLTIAMTREFSAPFTGGEMTQMPVSLTGVLRFRKDRAFNPFLGAGVGKVFMDFDPGDELYALNRTIDSMHVKLMTDEHGESVTPQFHEDRFADDGAQPALGLYSLSFDIEDSWEWHLSAGMEYALGDRVGLVAEVRYVFYQTDFSLTMGGEAFATGPAGTVSLGRTGPEDQVNYDYWPGALYHPDGSLRVFNDQRLPPNSFGFGPERDRRFACTPNDALAGVEYGPGAIADIDGNGLMDACYDADLVQPAGQMVVQGGEFDLSGFTVQLGLRWYF